MNKIEQTKKALVEAMHKSLGIVTKACNKVGVSRGTFYKYYNEDKEFAKACDDAQDIALDFAESQLHKQIEAGNSTSTIFYLKTKGKHRGYIERQDIGITKGEDVDGIPLIKWTDNDENNDKNNDK